MKKVRNHLAVLFVLTAAVSRTAGAQAVRPDLSTVTLEDLMNITITTASRTAEGAIDAPARVQVVTAADIRRRGYRSLADLLKDLSDVKVVARSTSARLPIRKNCLARRRTRGEITVGFDWRLT